MELLSPAGSLEKLKYAYAFGADAAYAGVPIFSLRARENDFALDSVREGVAYAKALNKKIYLTVNIFARNVKIQRFQEFIPEIAAMKPDGLIMSDPGLIMMVKESAPEIPIHLSVQANCMNYQGVKFWQKIGVERVILSRELKVSEIKTIKDKVPDMELEAFVHGSICIAYSGRCLMSHYMSNRDANQGICDNSCRYPVNVHASPNPDAAEYHYIEDHRNPGEMYRIDEDENGTYLMNSKDLCLIEHLKEIIDAGVCSLKIEGRTKSIHYLSVVTKCYRKAIDDLAAGRPFDRELVHELDTISTRGYTTGFMVSAPSHESQCYDLKERPVKRSFLGVVSPQTTGENVFPVEVRGQIRKGKTYQVLSPERTQTFTLEHLFNIKGQEIDVAHPGTGFASIALPFKPDMFSLLRENV